MQIERCGGCFFGKFIPQDVSKRVCYGAPPSALQVPAGVGQAPRSTTLQMARPVVNVSDEACALYRPRAEETAMTGGTVGMERKQ